LSSAGYQVLRWSIFARSRRLPEIHAPSAAEVFSGLPAVRGAHDDFSWSIASGPDDARHNFLPSGNVTSRPVARPLWL
jgi:hypothetical protein